jgi:hypothetical protein
MKRFYTGESGTHGYTPNVTTRFLDFSSLPESQQVEATVKQVVLEGLG